MTGPTRFKVDACAGRAGHLMRLGSAEIPDREAVHRAAVRLRISAAAMAAASAGIATASNASAAALAGTTATASGAGTVASSLLAATLVKGALVGLSFGLVSLAVGRHFVSPAQRMAATPVAVAVGSNSQSPLPDPKPNSAQGEPMQSALPQATALAPTAVGASASDLAPASASVLTPARAPIANRRAVPTEVPLGALPSHANPVPLEASTAPASAQVPPLQVLVAPSEPERPGPKRDPQLLREVSSLDQIRILLGRGDARGAAREFETFERTAGFRLLRREALLVQVNVLTALGHRKDAAATARQVLRLGVSDVERARLQAVLSHDP